MTCDCKVCTDHYRWKNALNPTTRLALAAFEEMELQLEAAQTDASYYKAILAGTWPNAREILENALEKLNDR